MLAALEFWRGYLCSDDAEGLTITGSLDWHDLFEWLFQMYQETLAEALLKAENGGQWRSGLSVD
jgi:hypothetical protein